uniref:Uncharacterized protein n=1 Tax=Rhizophora mucronata TaxID=61149 RepID=A0A2P2MKK6_RHIMU
MPFSLFLCVQV